MTALHPSPPSTHATLRRRILVCAYAVCPNRGSEPGIGWNVVSRLARRHDITVLAAPAVPGSPDNNFKETYDQFIANHGPIPGLTLHWIHPPFLSRLLQRESLICRRTFYYTGYAAWQRAAFTEAKKLHTQIPFDLIHHLNITGFREPGYLWQMKVPFIWGPIAGAAAMPPNYFDLLSRTERLYYALRNWTNARQKRSRRCRAAARVARHIWAVSPEDESLAQQQWGRTAEHLRESASEPRQDGQVRTYDRTRPLRLIWSGQHIGRKALPILLHALTHLRHAQPAIELTVLGEGPENAHWKHLAAQLNLTNITWPGWLPRDQALAAVGRSDLLITTSLLEGTPQAMLEAMALGLPVICHNICGMATAITDDCGIRIPLTNSTGSAQAFATAIQKLLKDPKELQRLAAGALARTQELSWDNQVARMLEVYNQILTHNNSEAS